MLTPEEIETCVELLQRISDEQKDLPPDYRLFGLISKIYREGRKRERVAQKRREEKLEDRAVLAATGLVAIQRDAEEPAALPPPPASRRLNQPEYCYVCKEPYHDVHFFYHFLCPTCAHFNYTMRGLSANLKGRIALVTGGRVKIGHQLVLRLLRDGARVLVTTRFPNAAAKRFHAEPDSADWSDRLQIFGLDLRNIPAVEELARHLQETLPHLDIVVHNAAQTVKRPSGFYQELVEQEAHPEQTVALGARQMVALQAPATLGVDDSSQLLPAVMPGVKDVLPADRLHDNEERADFRDVNSWLLPLESVSAQELLEVQLVNSTAPFILNARLKALLVKSPHERRFIVNVSAVEGQFSRHKTIYHPHTNMAKAALNMMTRTSGAGYAKDGIYMTSVDTGWVTDENPTPKRARKQEELGWFAPLDIVDGMARIYHPIAVGIENPETPYFGVFLKDYAPCKW